MTEKATPNEVWLLCWCNWDYDFHEEPRSAYWTEADAVLAGRESGQPQYETKAAGRFSQQDRKGLSNREGWSVVSVLGRPGGTRRSREGRHRGLCGGKGPYLRVAQPADEEGQWTVPAEGAEAVIEIWATKALRDDSLVGTIHAWTRVGPTWLSMCGRLTADLVRRPTELIRGRERAYGCRLCAKKVAVPRPKLSLVVSRARP